jgi:hypothetical protein
LVVLQVVDDVRRPFFSRYSGCAQRTAR